MEQKLYLHQIVFQGEVIDTPRGNDKKGGQALVEMALILPIIVSILMGIIQFGLIFNQYMVISRAAREGARVAGTGGTDSATLTAIDTILMSIDSEMKQSPTANPPVVVSPPKSTTTKTTITISPSGSRTSGSDVTITVVYRADIIIPIAPLIPNPLPIRAVSVMRVE